MNIEIKLAKPPPTDAEILQVEQRLDIKLNKEFIDFTRHYDGGIPESNIFRVSRDNDSSIRSFIALLEIPRQANLVRERLGQFIIPVAYAACGNYVCLSNERSDGEIYYFDHEIHDGNSLIRLAPSFARFLDMVHPFDTSQITPEFGQVKSVWIDPEFLEK